MLIERELGQQPPELVWLQMERKGNAEKRKEHVRRLVSWCLLETIKADPDGILTLDEAAAAGHVAPEGAGRVTALFVAPDWRRRYWGSRLAQALGEELRETG